MGRLLGSQEGMAYVAILLLLTLVSTLGYSLLVKVGTETAAVTVRANAMQAQYLAESAANHAMWRLLHQGPQSVEVRVAHNHDDAEQEQNILFGIMDLQSQHLMLGSKFYVGCRFLDVPIPQGATITEAHVEFTDREADNDPTDLTVFGQNSNSAGAFSGWPYDLSSRPRTAASVTWHGVPVQAQNTSLRTPDLSAIVQEIVNRPGWASGNALVILFRSDDLSGRRRVYAHDHTPARAALLRVSYGDSTHMAEDVYYMHELAGGRYGYKVRWPTENTFGAVSAVGTLGEHVARQGYLLDIKTADEAAELLCQGLVGYWRMNAAAGSAFAVDSSGYGNLGTLRNMDTWTAWVDGAVGGALDLDGTNAHVTVEDSDALDLTDQITLAAWVRPDPSGLTGYRMVLNKGDEGFERNYWLGTLGDEISFGYHNLEKIEFTSNGAGLQAGTWQHLAATYDGEWNTVRLFLDGRRVNEWNTAAPSPPPNDGVLFLGRSQSGEPFHGRMDDVRIYNRALRPEEISVLHDLTAPACSGTPGNLYPVVDAGPDQAVWLRRGATPLEGSVTDDGLPDPPASVTSLWSVASGPAGATFDDPSEAGTIGRFTQEGAYVLRLQATDSELLDWDEVSIAVEREAYVEARQEWTPAGQGSWRVQDLGGAPFNVPPGAVLEVAILNTSSLYSRFGGVRATGSTLNRRIKIHRAEGGGSDALVMHVQADDASRIETYAQSTNDIRFVLLGYWTVGEYVETLASFTSPEYETWCNYDLRPHGVAPRQVAEVVMINSNQSQTRTAGVRTLGSDLNRTVQLQRAKGSLFTGYGLETASLFVRAHNNNNASIQLWAQDENDVTFHLVGYWSRAPGTYVQAAADLGPATASATWQDRNLSGFGVPGEAVAQITLANRQDGSGTVQGVRGKGSSLNRWIHLQGATSAAEDLATMHVTVDAASVIQRYQQNATYSHTFTLHGWWE